MKLLFFLITNNGDNFLTSVNRKKHSIGLHTNPFIHKSFSCKIGLAKSYCIKHLLSTSASYYKLPCIQNFLTETKQ